MEDIKYEGEFIVAGNRRYLNKYGLPPEMLNALLKNRYFDPDEKPFDESASTLTAPTQAIILQRRHPLNLRIKDVTELFPSFMGSVAHQVLEDSWVEGMSSTVEERVYVKINGKILSGKLDCYDPPEIRDYKSCKAYKIIAGAKEGYDDWEAGQNIYAYLLRRTDRIVERLNVWALIFNWDKTEFLKNPQVYPPCQFFKVPLKLWTFERQEVYIKDRLLRLECAANLPDGPDEGLTFEDALAASFPCSKKEMWQRLMDVAVYRNGTRGRAYRKFGTMDEAAQFILDNKLHHTHEAIERWSRRIRCLEHCDASPVCSQHRQLCLEEGVDFDPQPCIF